MNKRKSDQQIKQEIASEQEDHKSTRQAYKRFKEFEKQSDYKRAYSVFCEFPEIVEYMTLKDISCYYPSISHHIGKKQAEIFKRAAIQFLEELCGMDDIFREAGRIWREKNNGKQ